MRTHAINLHLAPEAVTRAAVMRRKMRMSPAMPSWDPRAQVRTRAGGRSSRQQHRIADTVAIIRGFNELFRSKPTQDAEPAEGVLDEREIETANPARQRKDPPICGPLTGLRGAFWLKVGRCGCVGSGRTCRGRGSVPNQGDFGEARMADGLFTNRRISQANRSSESAPSG